MITISSQLLIFLETILFASVIAMHLTKRNFNIILLYAVQSFVIAVALLYSSINEASLLLLLATILTFLVKVVVAPYFFSNIIKKYQQYYASSYLNTPLTLIILALLTAFSSYLFRPLIILSQENASALFLAVGMMLVSIFLVINRKGVLSQMIGILSLENAIVSFAYIANLEATAGSQIGILFDIFIWVAIATIFASMIYKHFGSLDASEMSHLKEE